MKRYRLVELTTILHRGGGLPIDEARECTCGICNGNSAFEALAFRLVTQTHSADDAVQFSVACKLVFAPVFTEMVQWVLAS